MDECKRCTVRGDMGACLGTTCNIHESWHAQQLHARLAEVEAQKMDAERRLAELVEAVRWWKECELVRHYIIFDALETCALREITRSIFAARAAVDALVGEG